MKRIVLIGPAHPLRGGLATFNHRLAREFTRLGYTCSLVSFSLQYPSVLFPGKSQYTTEPAPTDIEIHSLINSVHPLNWLRVGHKIKNWKPDVVVVRYWLPFMGPALGTILRVLKRNRHTKVICIADNVLPHEKRPGDTAFTKYFIKACDGFVTMSEKVMNDLRRFERNKPAKLVLHPLYDNFGQPVDKMEARNHLGLKEGKLLLFFGFVRKYKGLDLLLRALADPRIREQNIRLLIAGEFYEDEKPYLEIIKTHQLEEAVILRNNFIPDSEVRYYLCSGDCVVQPYRDATQSGVTPLAYHFEKPMIVTNVGGLPAMVPHQKSGLVCEPEPASIAHAILQFYQLGHQHFIPHLLEEKKKYSWEKLVQQLMQLATETSSE